VRIIAVGVSVGTMVRNRDANRRLDSTTAALPCVQMRDPGSVVLLAVTREPGHTPPPSPGSAPVAVAAVA